MLRYRDKEGWLSSPGVAGQRRVMLSRELQIM
jgi:hypothetical protein